jgi:hypothetical protein
LKKAIASCNAGVVVVNLEVVCGIGSRDRCYDIKNIFAQKIGEKIGVFHSKQSTIIKNFDHNIG